MLKKLSTCILSVLLLLPVVGCQDDLPDEQEGTEGKGTVTLTFTAEAGRMVQTQSEVRPVTPGSEAEKASFSYEMVVTSIDSTSQATKAMPVSFKNATALLFTSAGTFNGRATIGNFQGGVPLTATFTGVTTTNATNCRVVLVADDAASTLNLAVNNALKNYSGTYATFCVKGGPEINSETIKNDTDIPYVGSIEGINLSNNATTINSIPLYRMLAKVSLTALTTNMPQATFAFTQIRAIKSVPFGTSNGYDGSGRVLVADTAAIEYIESRTTISNIFYVGEKIMKERPEVASYQQQEYNKHVFAPVLRVVFSYSEDVRKDIHAGEEYVYGGSENWFEFDIFLGSDGPSDFSVRRNHSYDITINLNGTMADFIAQSVTDNRIRPYTNNGEKHQGLCVGRLGGFVALANGTNFYDVKGYYTKMLLLEPNTSREIGVADSKTYVWNASSGSSDVQPNARRYWDYDYIKGLDNGLGGMSNVSGSAYNYCRSLTLGGVAAGTWYVPTQQQMSAIQTVLAGMQENPVFGYYSTFNSDYYWSATESSATTAWMIYFINGNVNASGKVNRCGVRCVRDL